MTNEQGCGRQVGRRATRNLVGSGYLVCAAFVAKMIRRDAAAYMVFVSPTGDIRARRVDRSWLVELPTEWWVGTYAPDPLRLEFIESDLMHRERELRASFREVVPPAPVKAKHSHGHRVMRGKGRKVAEALDEFSNECADSERAAREVLDGAIASIEAFILGKGART